LKNFFRLATGRPASSSCPQHLWSLANQTATDENQGEQQQQGSPDKVGTSYAYWGLELDGHATVQHGVDEEQDQKTQGAPTATASEAHVCKSHQEQGN